LIHATAEPPNVPDLMAGLHDMRQVQGHAGAVVEAACRSFAFVFLHPFGDGSGRIHRLLLHHVLAIRRFLPPHLVVPISSVILRTPHDYDAVLEGFSRAVLPLVKCTVGDEGELRIQSAPDDAHQFPDLTPQCEACFGWLETALEEDLPKELAFLSSFDEVRRKMRRIIEMPDRKELLFIKLCLQGGGRLSKTKRALFSELSDETIERLERVVAVALNASS
jgi:hypothetical protein